MVTALHPNKKERRKKRKKKRGLHIIWNAWEDEWKLGCSNIRPAWCPCVSFWYIIRVRAAAKISFETSPRRRRKHFPFGVCCCCCLWFNGSSRPTSSPTLSSPSFLRLFLYSQKPPTLFEKLVALQRYFLLCSYTAAFAIKFLPCPGDVNEEFSSLGFWKFNPTVPISVPCLRCIYLYQYVLHMQCYAAKIDYKAVPKVVDCYFVVACLLQPYTELLVNHHAKTFTGGITCKREWSAIVRH